MSLTDYDERSAAIRQALGLPAEDGTCVECGTCRADFGNSYEANADGELVRRETAAVDLSGHAADRERYVTERARQIARAFLHRQPMHGENLLADTTATFRDLIDRGVLK